MAAAEERFLSTEEVAERLQVDEQTVRRWIKSGKLEAFKPGREWRISPAAFEALLETYSSPKGQAALPLDSGERGGYPYPWMGETLARLIDGWEQSIEAEQVEGRYAHAVAIAAMDTLGAVLRAGEPGETMRDRVPETEVPERNALRHRLYELSGRAIDRYRASEVFDPDMERWAEKRRAEMRRAS